jgi:hypothetical protein
MTRFFPYSRCLLRQSYETPKYTACGKYRALNVKARGIYRNHCASKNLVYATENSIHDSAINSYNSTAWSM